MHDMEVADILGALDWAGRVGTILFFLTLSYALWVWFSSVRSENLGRMIKSRKSQRRASEMHAATNTIKAKFSSPLI